MEFEEKRVGAFAKAAPLVADEKTYGSIGSDAHFLHISPDLGDLADDECTEPRKPLKAEFIADLSDERGMQYLWRVEDGTYLLAVLAEDYVAPWATRLMVADEKGHVHGWEAGERRLWAGDDEDALRAAGYIPIRKEGDD